VSIEIVQEEREERHEIQVGKINYNNKTLYLINCYYCRGTTLKEADKLREKIDNFIKQGDVILVGDFNLDINGNNKNKRGSKVLQRLTKNIEHQIANKIQHTLTPPKGKASIADWVILYQTEKSTTSLKDIRVTDIERDHKVTSWRLKTNQAAAMQTSTPYPKTNLLHNPSYFLEFTNAMKNMNIEGWSSLEEAEIQIHNFCCKELGVVGKRKTKTRPHKASEYWSEELQELKEKKKQKSNKMQKTTDAQEKKQRKEEFEEVQATFRAKLRQERKRFYHSLKDCNLNDQTTVLNNAYKAAKFAKRGGRTSIDILQSEDVFQAWKTIFGEKNEGYDLEKNNREAEKLIEDMEEGEPWEISYEEVQKAINTLKNNKARDIEGITNEVMKAMPKEAISKLAKLITELLRDPNHCMPSSWKRSLVILLKKIQNPGAQDYRPISLLIIMAKLVEKIMLERARQQGLEKGLCKEQGEFRKGKGTEEQVWLLLMMDQISAMEKKPLYVVKLDIKKAYDNVP